jgi:hypothetical protein
MDKPRDFGLEYGYENLENRYGRSKSVISFTFILFFACSGKVLAFSGILSPEVQRVSIDTFSILKILIPLFIAIVAVIVVPLFRYYHSQRTVKKSYLIYLKANIKSTLDHYGDECSIDYARAELPASASTWIDSLEKSNTGVPLLLVDIYQKFEKAEAQAPSPDSYIPFVSYSVMPISELSHDHPIWSLEKEQTKWITGYLLSQAQVVKSIRELYSAPFFDLLSKAEIERRRQWVHGGYVLVEELAEHYINTISLKKKLNALLS